MKTAVKQEMMLEEAENVSLCSMFAGEDIFGIDTAQIREVLGKRDLERVPMAPAFVAGVVPYRGDVLTTVSFRALLGLPESAEAGCVLVLEDDDVRERFGLVVDSVGGVVTVNSRMLEVNPCTLESRCKWLFDGAYKMPSGLMVRLDPQKLRPTRLAESGMFRQGSSGDAA
ncbi:MAG: chemotaxis protein CheW [Edaphobacter sp.]|uniref:chemotaxis protein CheW n=1 Tax=Edaphobacter sp. TaxID=1934404 RepID=UPI00239786A7|nr:chemotaxis protein CheW [Edaphobacter sp.]MDE1174992.1 chemotaxis protein CheW [Edaphobacter sp.]